MTLPTLRGFGLALAFALAASMAQAGTTTDTIRSLRRASNTALRAADLDPFMLTIDPDYIGPAGNGGHVRSREELRTLIGGVFREAPASTPGIGGRYTAAQPTAAQEPPAQATNPLDAFGALVVGTWEADDSRHVLEWGVGRRVVRSRGYYPSDDGWKLVSEGLWYWDGDAEVIRGVVVAIDMPIDRFEYESRVDGNEIVHALRATGVAGGDYVETWTFGPDGYRWRVEQAGSGARVMGGSYRRGGAGGPGALSADPGPPLRPAR